LQIASRKGACHTAPASTTQRTRLARNTAESGGTAAHRRAHITEMNANLATITRRVLVIVQRGTVRDQVATVVKALETYNQGVHGQPTPMAYGAFVADTLLPDVLRYTPGTTALWDPWNGTKNGKGLREELASNFARMVVNSDFSTKLTQTEKLLDYFPYLAPPPDS
jgi:hypothetical protein